VELTERARRIYRNYPPHVQQREQAKLILELVEKVEALERLALAVEPQRYWDVLNEVECKDWFERRKELLGQ
jgi:GH25 family lysozyme M1 (1,4-beta-N-acetylmuramidase)